MQTFIESKNFENFFVDYSTPYFPLQAKCIYEEVGDALSRKEKDSYILNKSLSKKLFNVIFNHLK